MPNKSYAKGLEAFANGSINWLSDTIKVALVSSAYVPNLTTDQFWSSVVANVIGTPQALSGKTNVGGVLDASDVTFTAVPSIATYAIIYKDTGTNSTSPLIGLIDGEETVTAAVTANTGATSIIVDPLVAALAIGATVLFGGVTATLTATAAVGARSLTVSALSGGVPQGTVGVSSGQGGLPTTTIGADIAIIWDNTANKILKI